MSRFGKDNAILTSVNVRSLGGSLKKPSQAQHFYPDGTARKTAFKDSHSLLLSMLTHNDQYGHEHNTFCLC